VLTAPPQKWQRAQAMDGFAGVCGAGGGNGLQGVHCCHTHWHGAWPRGEGGGRNDVPGAEKRDRFRSGLL